MKTLSAEDYVEQHIKIDNIIEQALQNGDFKLNNREAKKLNQLVDIAVNNKSLALKAYDILLKNINVRTRAHAAAECLRLGIYLGRAEIILEEISQMEDIGITSFGAEMTLKIWRGEVPNKIL